MSSQNTGVKQPVLAVIIVAAGTGSRMQSSEHKQFLKLRGKPVLENTIKVFDRHPMVMEIILVSHEADLHRVNHEIIKPGRFKKITEVIPGGATRTASVKAGLQMITGEITHVAVHDGARPLVTPAMLDSVFIKGITTGAAILAAKITDTIKETDEEGKILSTIPRQGLWSAQTPQVFDRTWLESAYGNLSQDTSATDDAAVLEAAGYSVYTVECSKENLKITVPSDLIQAEMILKSRGQ